MPVPTEPLKVSLYAPTSAQMELHESKARFRTMSCGRRFRENTCLL